MNKKLVGTIAAGVVVAIAAIVVSSMIMKPSEQQPSAAPIAAQPTPQQQPPATEESKPAPGVYADYSDEALKTTSGTKVIFFHAPWCPQCRELDKSIKVGSIPPDVTIFKVDYDSNQALRKKYGVTIQTTLVKVDDTGALVKKYVAYNKPDLQALIENLL
ncbi:MAG TPA: thioredoxin family protein [Candidatus Saccharimonadales bacterium]|nr:thioredoxin family protein [Candidatus Saccharimonadales bacterium]